MPLTIVVTSLDDGVEEWLTEGPALEAVLASAALPGSSRRSSAKAVVASTGAWSTTRRFRSRWQQVHAGSTSFCAAASTPSDRLRATLRSFACRFRAVDTHTTSPGSATGPADVDVVVLEQSGVEEILWQDFCTPRNRSSGAISTWGRA